MNSLEVPRHVKSIFLGMGRRGAPRHSPRYGYSQIHGMFNHATRTLIFAYISGVLPLCEDFNERDGDIKFDRSPPLVSLQFPMFSTAEIGRQRCLP